jgi:hypothetical protein
MDSIGNGVRLETETHALETTSLTARSGPNGPHASEACADLMDLNASSTIPSRGAELQGDPARVGAVLMPVIRCLVGEMVAANLLANCSTGAVACPPKRGERSSISHTAVLVQWASSRSLPASDLYSSSCLSSTKTSASCPLGHH